ncbi:hypothetical protein IQR32_03655 [Acinetobacter albensis]|uniref:hypothetical protein n=1 Tax=Acinetobacter albensis TaxID=1673609 RepID=UPI001881613D|nr:hypothetical protein [Acinetobacter albensis]MBE9400447.1 hypothetical protein [Acinetobacter albensis]
MKYILALTIVFVVGLFGGFFIGFGVTNKDLDVDWKAITPIFSGILASAVAATTALYISNKWKSQKGGEVVANEAKQTIKDLLEIINISYHMNSYSASPEMIAEKYARFVILSEQILRSSLFINECIVIDNLNFKLNEFNEICWAVKGIGLESDPVRNHNEFKNKLAGKVGYIGSLGMSLVKILRPYSVYQKDFKFKKI